MNMRILILGDSLSLPRERPERCEYENTWPRLLAKDFSVHQVSIGGATIRDLERQVEYHQTFKPDVVILQSGIVDCAPRALSKLELQLLSKLFLSRKIILPIVQRKASYLRKHRGKVYTSRAGFEHSLHSIVKKLGDARVFCLSILPGSPQYESIVPGITKNIDVYNAVLEKTFRERFISLAGMDRIGIMSDHIHLNAEGHRYVYECILKALT